MLLRSISFADYQIRGVGVARHPNYALWDVIKNGNSFKLTAQTATNAEGTSTTLVPGPVTSDEKTQKKNDVKARSMLLMALPNEHLLTFNQYKDTKTLFAAIQTRFGGNDATRKTQKTLLKQMYEKFSAPSTESLDFIFNRLQKIVSQLAILGENILQEDLNLKFLRSLPSEWNTYVVVWRNKPDLDTMSFDDLYNNFKIVEQEVKGTANSSSSSSSQNMAFISSPSSTNEVNTAYRVSTDNIQVSITSTQDLEQIHKDDLEEIDLKWQLALLSMRTRRFFQKTGRKITINGSDTAGYDKSKVECFNCHKLRHFARECKGPRNQDNRSMNQDSSRRTINVEEISSKAMLAIDGAGFDWSFMADEEVPTDMALMAFSDSEFNKSKFNLATYKRRLASVKEQLVFYKKNEVIFYEQIAVLKRDISYKDSKISVLKSELEKLKQEKESNQLKIENFDNASKSLDKLIRSWIPDKSRKGVGFVSYYLVPPPPIGLFTPPTLDLSNSGLEDFQQPEFEGYGPKTSKSVSEDISNKIMKSLDAPLVEELVSDDKLKKKTANCNYHQRERVLSGSNYTRVNYNYSAKKVHPNAHRNMVPRAVLMKTGLRTLNIARPVNTDHPKTTVYSARPMSHFSKSAQSTVNVVKASTCWVLRPTKLNSASITFKRHNYVDARGRSKVIQKKEDQGYVDSECSRHMTGNMFYLSDFKEFDRGYVTFGGGAKGGRITGKGTLKTGKLDFKDVYFVKELQFNLFSDSQMYDKKNSVLFTDTGCFVLSPDFKLTDKSNVLLKVPRKNNMYSVDMKNIVPKEYLTCLVANATLDESMLWHKRLGHIKFKTIKKLVKDNLVKGLPINILKITKLVLLALRENNTKPPDETGGILKSFITQIENLVDKKVKIIRCDNETEFKNRVMSEFCEKKGIKRDFNNRVLVVKPHNKTLYELFRGRTPSLSFMRPFGCHVTILNTLDHLGKFDGKSDDGFFVGYSLNSKAFRVYNIRTRKVEENLHVRFLEDKPIIAGGGRYGSLFDSSPKNTSNDEPQPSSDVGEKDDESGIDDQEKPEDSSLDVNTGGPSINTASTNFNTGSLNINTVSPTVPTAPLESTYADFFGDESEFDLSNIATTYPVPSTPNTRIHKDHSLDHVIGDVQFGVRTMRMINEQGFICVVYEGKTHEDLHTCLFACFLSQEDPKKVIQELKDPSWIEAMQEELLNKKDERVARIDAIRMFLAYASFKDFVVYQMDVKSEFLYVKIEEEVYVYQPPGFEDPEFPDKVYKVEKALYGLHQAPRAWYETLSTYLLDNGFQRGQIDKTLFIKRIKSDILLVQMSSMGELTFFFGLKVTQKDDGIYISQEKYVDEILKKFGFSTVKTASTPMDTSKPLLKDAEAKDVDVHLYRSIIRSLMYLTASRPDIMFVVCACARFQVTPKGSHLYAVKRIFRYLKGKPKLRLWYPKDSSFDLEAYTDSDYAGVSLDRKSTTRGCQFLESKLISWQCKKQTIVANSTTEAEYVAASSFYGQVLWIQNQMLDYGYNFMNTKIFIDSESIICIVMNPVFHSKTRHIKIRHHFISDSNEKKLIQMIKIQTDHNVADLLTKAFDVGRFQYLIASIGMLNP
ncbi:putative ribonuclease H-like domain-containing protein [Tanacetum coccineum]